jgi:four helix bundle protein
VRQLSHKLLDRSYRDRSAIDQFYRSGTSVGANIREARYAESAKDLVHKLKIAEKELAEFYYWLGLLTTEPMMITDIAGELLNLANQIGKLLTASIITLKQKHKL